MSVVNEFDCRTVRIQESTKTLFMLGLSDGMQYTFKFDIACKAELDIVNLRFYFNIKDWKMLAVYKDAAPISSGFYKCILMKFWLEGDSPVPAVQYFVNQHQIMSSVTNDFKEKYASILIDDAINS